MIRLLRNDGVRFPDDQKMKFAALDPLEEDILHAEGSWESNDESDTWRWCLALSTDL